MYGWFNNQLFIYWKLSTKLPNYHKKFKKLKILEFSSLASLIL